MDINLIPVRYLTATDVYHWTVDNRPLTDLSTNDQILKQAIEAIVERDRGEDGKSAYEVWLEAGNTGTVQDYLNSLKGESAYQTWLDEGNTGSPQDFLNSLKGADGEQGEQGPQGPQGPQGEAAGGLLPDAYGNLTEALIAQVEAAGNEFVYVVNPDGDMRADKNIPATLAGDQSRNIIGWTPTNGWRSYGQFTGVQGPPGPMGPQGPVGEKGPRGLQGPVGPAGPVGLTGPAGPEGPKGAGLVPNGYGNLTDLLVIQVEAMGVDFVYVVNPNGDVRTDKNNPASIAGDQSLNIIGWSPTNGWRSYGQFTGVRGETGPAGPAGPTGIQGPQGPEGPAGPDGPAGPQGPIGPTGATGANGPAGSVGPAGAQGPSGPAGPQGQAGVQGPVGPQGPGLIPDGFGDLTDALISQVESEGVKFVYVVNPNGDLRADKNVPVGIEGDQSLKIIGWTTANGWQSYGQFTGVAGPAGPQGVEGPSGATGPQGPIGIQGPQGPAGPAGPQGEAGPAGSQGPAGVQGNQGPRGLQGDPGPMGIGIHVLGALSDPSLLPDPASLNEGDTFLIQNHFWVVVGQTWEDVGDVSGPAGQSAYQLAVEEGFTGTEQEWLESLHGRDGIGLRILGSLNSTADLPTLNNQSGDSYIINYVMWVWDSSAWAPVGQVGPAGKSSYQLAKDAGQIPPTMTLNQYLDSLKGKSAYQLALDSGQIPPGTTLGQWLDSLNGTDGESAYQLAVDAGFSGTMQQWLASLVGPRGATGPQGDIGPQGPQGVQANSIRVLGTVPNEASLPVSGDPGDGYFIGRNLWVYTGTQWVDIGEIQGPQGVQGEQGPVGPQGAVGATGDDAYQVAVSEGYVGTRTQWLASLKGDQGESAYQVAKRNDPSIGTEAQWLASLNGDDGLSAYQVAVQNGFVGTEAEWLVSIRGAVGPAGPQGVQGAHGQNLEITGQVATPGDLPASPTEGTAYVVGSDLYIYLQGAWYNAGPFQGDSAYKVAVKNGFLGTEPQWLATLVGPQGARGLQGEAGAAGATGPAGQQGEMGLQGPAGPQGPTGPQGSEGPAGIQGPVGPQGPAGPDGPQGPEGPEGPIGAGIKIIGELPSPSDLPPSGTPGDGYLINGDFWAWTGTQWQNVGKIQGPEGPRGPTGLTGATGQSAYQLAVEQGFQGNSVQWIASLHGEKGDTGIGMVLKGTLPTVGDLPTTGNQPGDGYFVQFHLYVWLNNAWADMGDFKGATGDSAYEIAVQEGFSGTKDEWLTSLIGPIGPQGEQGEAGPQGPEGAIGPQGEPGPQGIMGPGISILGTLTDPSQLPANDPVPPDNERPIKAGQGYLINGHFWGWIDTPPGWQDLGVIQGPIGPQGPRGLTGAQGPAGAQGPRGEQGVPGSRWISIPRNPGPADGNINDNAINTVTNEYFLKVTSLTWTSLGHLGGGNVYDAPFDGEQYVRKDGDWQALQGYVPEAPNDGKQYVRKSLAWAEIADVIPLAQKGVANGVATLDGTGKVPAAQLPPVGIPEAPNDGKQYVRKSLAWAELADVIPLAQKGVANGVATLDATGKVPSAQLPAVGIPEAPTDGKAYVRLNGAWVDFSTLTIDGGTY